MHTTTTVCGEGICIFGESKCPRATVGKNTHTQADQIKREREDEWLPQSLVVEIKTGGTGGTLELNALYPYNVKWWKYQGQHENAPDSRDCQWSHEGSG